ncbi:MAG: baseplate J/gp47 family protein [Lachnospirales bacterium]
MFEDMTYENILNSALDRVTSVADKRQGSVIYDALAPACAFLADAYVKMELILENSFADTASRNYLILRAKERGIEPYGATYALCKGVFDAEVPLGKRFSIGGLTFKVTEKLSDFEYAMECESAGSEGNKYFGTLTPIDYIGEITSANLTEVLVPARDEEDTESFRERYFNEINGGSFGGNKADYIKWVKKIDGVGQVRVKRVDSVSGKINVIVLNSQNLAPSPLLLSTIKEKLDPSDKTGLGGGLAPVGHSVNVIGPDDIGISIVVKESLYDGASQSYVIEESKKVIEDYISELNSKWEDFDDGIEIYSAQIIVRLLKINGIKNVDSLTIDGKNYCHIEPECIVVLDSCSVSFS